jgi:hypothetical protein
VSGQRQYPGARIDPATAEVWFVYAPTLDPYGELELEPEEWDVGRQWCARDPVEQVAVSFYELPAATREALEGKRRAADREGWAELIGGAVRWLSPTGFVLAGRNLLRAPNTMRFGVA